MQPVSIVEDEGFKRLVTLLDSRYDIPSRRTIMRMLPEKYRKVRAAVEVLLVETEYVSLTTDIWTSRATQGYITLTAHFLTHSWELKNVVLETFNLTCEHTAENIASILKRIVREWRIEDKVVAIVTDNASNITAAVKLTGWRHIPCFAHTLNLVVQEAIKADSALVMVKKKCKDIVAYFHHSAKAMDKLREIQKQVGAPENKLIQEVDTTWNSTFYMFERMLQQHQAVTTTLCLMDKNTMCFTVQEMDILKSAVTILRPFEAATTEVSADKYVSISILIPLAKTLLHFTAGTGAITTVSSELLTQLRRRFGSMEGNHSPAVSTLLDPRLKKVVFRDPIAAQQGVDWIIQEMSSVSAATSAIPPVLLQLTHLSTCGRCLMLGLQSQNPEEEAVLTLELRRDST